MLTSSTIASGRRFRTAERAASALSASSTSTSTASNVVLTSVRRPASSSTSNRRTVSLPSPDRDGSSYRLNARIPLRVRRRCRIGSVGVEALAGLPAEAPGGHVLAEERAGRVALVAEAALEDLHDRDAGVEADQIGERERAHLVVEAEL